MWAFPEAQKVHSQNAQLARRSASKMQKCLGGNDTIHNQSFKKHSNEKSKIVSATILLVCFVCLNESTCETKKNVFYFTSKALFVLEITKL